MSRRAHPDFLTLAPQGPSQAIPIEATRQAMARLMLRPFSGRACVVIVDGADRLTEEAANSLLKTLEEPPAHAYIVALAAHLNQCLPTIVSRCQAIRFHRLAPPLLEELLLRAQPCDPSIARHASRLAHGSLARAIELVTEWAVYEQMWTQLENQEASRWLAWTVPMDRTQLARWLAGSIAWMRDVAVASVADRSSVHHAGYASSIQRQAIRIDRDRCIDSALQVIRLWQSLTEQFVSPRLVGTLLREQWLSLLTTPRGS